MTMEAKTRDDRLAIYDLARSTYPQVSDPGAVWVALNVLEWTWEELARTPEDGLNLLGYARYVIHYNKTTGKDEKVIVNGESVRVQRKWTKEERSKLAKWWWLLGL